MAKSLFNQFVQIRGSRAYNDSLPLTVSGVTNIAEVAGKAKELNLYVDASGTTITRASGEFEKRDVGNVILIGGSAYGITTVSGASCTVSSAPGDGSAIPAALMYYQNLEDDLNYIRTMLREITGETDWFTAPDVALSELTFNFLELVDVFIGNGAYTPNNMLYTVSSGVVDTAQMQWFEDSGLKVSKHLSIGTGNINPNVPILISETISGSVVVGLYSSIKNSNAAVNADTYGIYSSIYDVSTQASDLIGVLSFIGQLTNNATIDNVIGVKGQVSQTSDGSVVTNVVAGQFLTNIATTYGSPTTISNMAAGEFQLNTAGANGGVNLTVTNAYGINIKTPGTFGAGVAGNLYGLYIADQSSSDFTNEYNIYSAGVNSLNYFAGKIQVGSLETPINSTAVVNEIINTVDGDTINVFSTDSQIVTAKLIYDYVGTVSGVLQGQSGLLEEIHQDTKEPTGFVNRADSAISNDNVNLTIYGTSWDYYIKGVKYTISGSKTVVIDNTFEGMQFFYMDTDSGLHRVNSWTDNLITDYAYVSAVYWDDAGSAAIYMGDERHGVVMDAVTHKYLHNTNGTVYISGLGITIVGGVNGNGSLNSHAQIGTTQGTIADEDIYHNINGISGPASIPVFYKIGYDGLWRREVALDFPVKPYVGGSVRLAYNQLDGGNWQQTEAAKGDYVLAHIFTTNDTTMQWIAVQGQATYSTIADARLGATNEMNGLILTGLPFVEFVPVATIIYHTDDDFTNDINARIISTDEGDDYIDWTKTKLSPIPGSVNDHGNLSGLTDLDHPAAAIYTDTTNFNGALSAVDNTTQKALDTLDNAIAGIGHAHHDHDLTEVNTNVWEYVDDISFTIVPADLQVFVNGLKNRNTSDYYTATISGGKITVTFAYNIYTEDWINTTYTKAAVA